MRGSLTRPHESVPLGVFKYVEDFGAVFVIVKNIFFWMVYMYTSYIYCENIVPEASWAEIAG